MVSKQDKSTPRAGNQGGTHEQHVEAGRQSHKNDASRQSDAPSNQQSGNQSAGSQSGRDTGASPQSGARSGAGVQGGTPEQHAAAGRQSHKNDKKR